MCADANLRTAPAWNNIPTRFGTAIVDLALEHPDLSQRELAVNFTDTRSSFVSQARVYRLLKGHGLITSPAFIVMKAAERFTNPTTASNQLSSTYLTISHARLRPP
jgi:putative transposase